MGYSGWNSDQAHALAKQWLAMGDALYNGSNTVRGSASGLPSFWTGASGTLASSGGAVTADQLGKANDVYVDNPDAVTAARACWTVGELITDYANKIDKIIAKEHMMELIMILVGVFSLLLVGLDILLGPALSALIAGISSALGRVLANFAVGAVEAGLNFGLDLAAQGIGSAAYGLPFDPNWEQAGIAAGLGGGLGVIGRGPAALGGAGRIPGIGGRGASGDVHTPNPGGNGTRPGDNPVYGGTRFDPGSGAPVTPPPARGTAGATAGENVTPRPPSGTGGRAGGDEGAVAPPPASVTTARPTRTEGGQQGVTDEPVVAPPRSTPTRQNTDPEAAVASPPTAAPRSTPTQTPPRSAAEPAPAPSQPPRAAGTTDPPRSTGTSSTSSGQAPRATGGQSGTSAGEPPPRTTVTDPPTAATGGSTRTNAGEPPRTAVADPPRTSSGGRGDASHAEGPAGGAGRDVTREQVTPTPVRPESTGGQGPGSGDAHSGGSPANAAPDRDLRAAAADARRNAAPEPTAAPHSNTSGDAGGPPRATRPTDDAAFQGPGAKLGGGDEHGGGSPANAAPDRDLRAAAADARRNTAPGPTANPHSDTGGGAAGPPRATRPTDDAAFQGPGTKLGGGPSKGEPTPDTPAARDARAAAADARRDAAPEPTAAPHSNSSGDAAGPPRANRPVDDAAFQGPGTKLGGGPSKGEPTPDTPAARDARAAAADARQNATPEPPTSSAPAAKPTGTNTVLPATPRQTGRGYSASEPATLSNSGHPSGSGTGSSRSSDGTLNRGEGSYTQTTTAADDAGRNVPSAARTEAGADAGAAQPPSFSRPGQRLGDGTTVPGDPAAVRGTPAATRPVGVRGDGQQLGDTPAGFRPNSRPSDDRPSTYSSGRPSQDTPTTTTGGRGTQASSSSTPEPASTSAPTTARPAAPSRTSSSGSSGSSSAPSSVSSSRSSSSSSTSESSAAAGGGEGAAPAIPLRSPLRDVAPPVPSRSPLRPDPSTSAGAAPAVPPRSPLRDGAPAIPPRSPLRDNPTISDTAPPVPPRSPRRDAAPPVPPRSPLRPDPTTSDSSAGTLRSAPADDTDGTAIGSTARPSPQLSAPAQNAERPSGSASQATRPTESGSSQRPTEQRPTPRPAESSSANGSTPTSSGKGIGRAADPRPGNSTAGPSHATNDTPPSAKGKERAIDPEPGTTAPPTGSRESAVEAGPSNSTAGPSAESLMRDAKALTKATRSSYVPAALMRDALTIVQNDPRIRPGGSLAYGGFFMPASGTDLPAVAPRRADWHGVNQPLRHIATAFRFGHAAGRGGVEVQVFLDVPRGHFVIATNANRSNEALLVALANRPARDVLQELVPGLRDWIRLPGTVHIDTYVRLEQHRVALQALLDGDESRALANANPGQTDAFRQAWNAPFVVAHVGHSSLHAEGRIRLHVAGYRGQADQIGSVRLPRDETGGNRRPCIVCDATVFEQRPAAHRGGGWPVPGNSIPLDQLPSNPTPPQVATFLIGDDGRPTFSSHDDPTQPLAWDTDSTRGGQSDAEDATEDAAVPVPRDDDDHTDDAAGGAPAAVTSQPIEPTPIEDDGYAADDEASAPRRPTSPPAQPGLARAVLDRAAGSAPTVVEAELDDALATVPHLAGRAAQDAIVEQGIDPDSTSGRDAVEATRVLLVDEVVDRVAVAIAAGGTDAAAIVAAAMTEVLDADVARAIATEVAAAADTSTDPGSAPPPTPGPVPHDASAAALNPVLARVEDVRDTDAVVEQVQQTLGLDPATTTTDDLRFLLTPDGVRANYRTMTGDGVPLTLLTPSGPVTAHVSLTTSEPRPAEAGRDDKIELEAKQKASSSVTRGGAALESTTNPLPFSLPLPVGGVPTLFLRPRITGLMTSTARSTEVSTSQEQTTTVTYDGDRSTYDFAARWTVRLDDARTPRRPVVVDRPGSITLTVPSGLTVAPETTAMDGAVDEAVALTVNDSRLLLDDVVDALPEDLAAPGSAARVTAGAFLGGQRLADLLPDLVRGPLRSAPLQARPGGAVHQIEIRAELHTGTDGPPPTAVSNPLRVTTRVQQTAEHASTASTTTDRAPGASLGVGVNALSRVVAVVTVGSTGRRKRVHEIAQRARVGMAVSRTGDVRVWDVPVTVHWTVTGPGRPVSGTTVLPRGARMLVPETGRRDATPAEQDSVATLSDAALAGATVVRVDPAGEVLAAAETLLNLPTNDVDAAGARRVLSESLSASALAAGPQTVVVVRTGRAWATAANRDALRTVTVTRFPAGPPVLEHVDSAIGSRHGLRGSQRSGDTTSATGESGVTAEATALLGAGTLRGNATGQRTTSTETGQRTTVHDETRVDRPTGETFVLRQPVVFDITVHDGADVVGHTVVTGRQRLALPSDTAAADAVTQDATALEPGAVPLRLSPHAVDQLRDHVTAGIDRARRGAADDAGWLGRIGTGVTDPHDATGVGARLRDADVLAHLPAILDGGWRPAPGMRSGWLGDEVDDLVVTGRVVGRRTVATESADATVRRSAVTETERSSASGSGVRGEVDLTGRATSSTAGGGRIRPGASARLGASGSSTQRERLTAVDTRHRTGSTPLHIVEYDLVLSGTVRTRRTGQAAENLPLVGGATGHSTIADVRVTVTAEVPQPAQPAATTEAPAGPTGLGGAWVDELDVAPLREHVDGLIDALAVDGVARRALGSGLGPERLARIQQGLRHELGRVTSPGGRGDLLGAALDGGARLTATADNGPGAVDVTVVVSAVLDVRPTTGAPTTVQRTQEVRQTRGQTDVREGSARATAGLDGLTGSAWSRAHGAGSAGGEGRATVTGNRTTTTEETTTTEAEHPTTPAVPMAGTVRWLVEVQVAGRPLALLPTTVTPITTRPGVVESAVRLEVPQDELVTPVPRAQSTAPDAATTPLPPGSRVLDTSVGGVADEIARRTGQDPATVLAAATVTGFLNGQPSASLRVPGPRAVTLSFGLRDARPAGGAAAGESATVTVTGERTGERRTTGTVQLDLTPTGTAPGSGPSVAPGDPHTTVAPVWSPSAETTAARGRREGRIDGTTTVPSESTPVTTTGTMQLHVADLVVEVEIDGVVTVVVVPGGLRVLLPVTVDAIAADRPAVVVVLEDTDGISAAERDAWVERARRAVARERDLLGTTVITADTAATTAASSRRIVVRIGPGHGRPMRRRVHAGVPDLLVVEQLRRLVSEDDTASGRPA